MCVCVCMFCVFAECSLEVATTWRKEGEMRAHVTTHLLVALYKARRGGRERRANRYWHLVEQGEAHAACWLKQHSSCAASEQSQHADSVRGYADKSLSITFHSGPAGLVRPCQHSLSNTTRHSPPTAHQEWHVTHTQQTHGTCSSIRQTGPTQSDSNQTESEAEHIGSVRVDEVNLLLLAKQHYQHQKRIHNSDVKDWTNLLPL